MTDQQPSTVTSNQNVEDFIFPDSDFRDDEPQTKPPRTYIDAQPIRSVLADWTVTQTFVLPSIINSQAPVMIIPQVGNNERRRSLITVAVNPVWLFASDDSPRLITLGANVMVAGGFLVPAGLEPFTYESAAALYALGNGADGLLTTVSVLSEMVLRTRRRNGEHNSTGV